MFAVEGSPRRVPAERAVRPRTACADARRGRRRARLDRGELARAAARNAAGAARPRRCAPATSTPRRCSTAQSHWRARAQQLIVASAAGHVADGVHDAAGPGRQTAPQLSAGCRGPRRRSGCRGRTRSPSAATVACATRTCRRRAGRRTTTSTSRPEHRPGIPYPEWNAWTKSFMPDHVAVLERAHTSRTRQPVPDVRRPAEMVRGTHPSGDEEPPRRRLRPRRRAVRQPLHRPDHRRGDRAAHLPRAAAQQPRRHHGAAARRQLVAGRARRPDLHSSNWPVPTRFPRR